MSAPYAAQGATWAGRAVSTGGRYAWQGTRWAVQQGIKYKVPSKLGGNYLVQSGQTGSFNPADHNIIGYGLSLVSPISIQNQAYIGAAGGLVDYTPSGGELNGFWNTNVGVTTIKILSGGLAPIYGLGGKGMGLIGGSANEILMGRGAKVLEETAPE